MDNSLFITRQLTDYREWPSGRHGCLFYVAEASFGQEYALGALCLIDAPYRKGDKVGLYNTLHQSEIDALQLQQPIAKGFTAFLLAQDYNQWTNDRELLDKWWTLYYEWGQNPRSRNGLETEYMLCECANWITRDKEMIESLLYNPNLKYIYSDALLHVIRSVFIRNTKSVRSVMMNWHPYIKISEGNTMPRDSDYIHYDSSANALMCGSTIFVSGMQAIILHFSVIRYVTQMVCKAQHLDKIIHLILHQLSDNSFKTLTLAQIRIPEYNIRNAKKIFDFAWALNKNHLMQMCEPKPSFYVLSKQQREWELIYKLYEIEIKNYNNNELLHRLPDEEAKHMQNLLSGFFVYLYDKLEGSEYAHIVYGELMHYFCDFKPVKISSSCFEGKTILQTINVQGDYIAGNKLVGNEIQRVESGGIGAQTVKE